VEWVAGLGGGSAIDAAKAIAGLIHEPHAVAHYFKGGAIEGSGLPLITIPTTAGSGAEVTINAVLSDPDNRLKQSIRDPRLAARVAIVDPELTLTLPPEATAYTGMDALVQAIEAFTSTGSGPFTDIYACGAIERIGANLLQAFQNGQDLPVRTAMLLGSLMAGVALTNARLGAVHGMAHSIGMRTGKPHGLVCAVLLVPVMRFNMPVSHAKYARIAQALGINTAGLDPIDAAAQGIKVIMELQRKLGLPCHIKDIGLAEHDFSAVAAESIPSGSLQANPRPAGESELVGILKEQF
jgi:alcohol dehydrogenase class IV